MSIRVPKSARRQSKYIQSWPELSRWTNDADDLNVQVTRTLEDLARAVDALQRRTTTTSTVGLHAAQHTPTGLDPLPTAAAGTILPDDTAAEGGANSFSRSDHRHGIVCAAPGAIAPDDTANEGVATSFTRSDHRHAITCDTAVDLGSSNQEGAASTFSRSNHVHIFPPTLRSTSATAGDTLTLTSDGTDLTLTNSRSGANLIYNDGAAVPMLTVYDSADTNRGGKINGHGLVGQGNNVVSVPTVTHVLAVAEKASQTTFTNILSTIPELDTNVGSGGTSSGGATSANYALRLTTGFESTDGGGPPTGEPFVLYGSRVNWQGALGGSALVGFASDAVAFDTSISLSFPATSAAWTEAAAFRCATFTLTNITPARGYGIKIAAMPPGTLRWAGMFAGDVQITSTNKLRLGATATTQATGVTLYQSSANNLRFQINAADELQLSGTSLFPVTNAGLGLGQNGNGWADAWFKDSAAAFETQVVFTDGSITADNVLTVNMGNASRTLTFSGSPTLGDWFDQSVKTTADVKHNTVAVLDTATSFYLKFVSNSAVGNFSADRTLTLNLEDADRNLHIAADSHISQDYRTTGTPQFARLGLGAAADATRLLTVNDGTSAPSTSAAVATTDFYGSGGTLYLSDPANWLFVKISGNTYKIPCYS